MISDPVPFMANIALVAHADGKLSPNELGQLEAIRQELKLKKSDFNAAIKLVERGDYQPTPVGTFADQVKNLEAILRVAYADDDLDKDEAKIIRAFCKTIGVTQEQLNRLCREVLATLKQQGKVCPKCGADNGADAAFCPKCGTNLQHKEAAVTVQLKVPKTGIAVEFAESTASGFAQALEIAKATSGYQSARRGSKTWHLAVFPSGKILDVLPLAEALSGMRNRAVYVDGEQRQWDEVLGFSLCASTRATAYDPMEYCFGKDDNRLNPWGCKQANMPWTEWAEWFCFGRWEKAGMTGNKFIWRFDKERIRHELARNLHRYRYCPFMVKSLIEAAINHLPDTVSPGTDPNWGYHEQYEQRPGAIKIVEKQREYGFTHSNEFWADGVKPKGLRGLADLLSKAFRDAQIPQSEAKSLLR